MNEATVTGTPNGDTIIVSCSVCGRLDEVDTVDQLVDWREEHLAERHEVEDLDDAEFAVRRAEYRYERNRKE